jgi:PAS domain S-box-containing protein
MEMDRSSSILVIDDEESIRTLLRITLANKGFEVFTAEDGEQGIEVFKRERPPMVITDIKMPGMDGIEVLKEIRQMNPDTRVIVITGHGDMESAIEALKLEASDFINKPITDEGLMVAIRRAEEILWMKQKLREYTGKLELKVKEATEELRKAADFQRNLIQSSIDGIMATDQSGTIKVFNQGAEELLGYSADEVIGRMHIDDTAPQGVAETIRRSFGSPDHGGKDRLVNYETALLSRGGTRTPVRISGTVMFDEGETIGYVFFFQDLREIKRLQKELLESERLSAVGQTVAGMAHYIKNILNGLEGGIYMVNTGFKKDKEAMLSRGWEMVQNNVGKISDLVMNMLSYSKEREPAPESCSPNEIVQQVLDLEEDRAKRSHVRLVKDLDSSMGDYLLDPDGLHRCLLNLVTNAIEACALDVGKDKDHSVIIRTGREHDGVRYEVADNGIGMSEEVKEKLFDRFFSTKGFRGSGFGLLVTRKIVEESGGTIEFESETGKGTTFTVRLPCPKS